MSTDLVLVGTPGVRAKAMAGAASQEPSRGTICESRAGAAPTETTGVVGLAGGIGGDKQSGFDFAHQLNNILTVILGHTEFLLKRKESQGVSRSRVEEIRRAAERGVWLTQQMLKQTAEPAPGPPEHDGFDCP